MIECAIMRSVLPVRILKSGLDKQCTVRRWLHQSSHSMMHISLEEQTLPRFYEKRYYPVTIGQTLHNRYQILTKLGFGANSTVWLARDLSTQQYASIKICVRDNSDDSPVTQECKIQRHISACANREDSGVSLLRKVDEVLEVDGHCCLVSKPYVCSLQQFRDNCSGTSIPQQFIMNVVVRTLGCLFWLQQEAGIVHTGNEQPANLNGYRH
jgi:hypothetical protein